MLSFLFFSYIAFVILVIVKNYKSLSIIWLCIMLIGFSCAFFGLASYTEYIASSVYYTDSKLFSNISKYIWIMNYYLDLDILSDYRIINIGIALYIYGALCFPVSYINNSKIRKYFYVYSAILPVLIILLYDPESLAFLLGLRGKDYVSALYAKHNTFLLDLINYTFNVLIKMYILLSIVVIMYVYKGIIPILRKKLIYMIFGIVPVHVLFLILFFWFPNHRIIFSRYVQLTNFSLPYNEFLYGFVTYFAFLSILLVIFAMWKYNIFEINKANDRVYFQKQVNTARIGLRVFSHSIKNQIIAIKLLAEQMGTVTDESRKMVIIKEITEICLNLIEKLGTLFKDMDVVKLRYENINMSILIDEVVAKHENVNRSAQFVREIKSNLFLYIDRKQFEKVLDNLIINAIEACSNQEKPTIKVALEERYNYGIITVIDNGSGIDKKNVKRVFEPFFSTKPMFSNWGIGLSHCQKVIEAFGGAIQIESKLDEGTTVNAFIPLDRRKLHG